jgi:dCMP deaminase
MTDKRRDYIAWPDYFMGIAVLSAHRSKDPNSQVGACIVNPSNRIVGIGYNGFPHGCTDEQLPWAREAEDACDTKYPYVCHAEMNAIMNKNAADVVGCTIYTTLFPCNECTKLIIQSGIGRVVYLTDKYHDTPSCRAARRMMDLAGVTYEPFTPGQERLTIDFAREARTAERA